MLVKYFSDIHLEFHDAHNQAYVIDNLIEDELADVIVDCGDLTTQNNLIEWLHYIDDRVKVPFIKVCGNHEYYGTQKGHIDELLKNEEFNNVHILNCDTFTHKGITFAGATGWWDESMSNQHIYALNDFIRIYDIKENAHGTVWGVRHRRFFKEVLEKTMNVVCISHNAPTHKCVHPQYKNSDINECFANHWDKIIKDYQPVAWIHGHMHNSVELEMGKTQILCNPYGYDRIEKNDEFTYTGYVQIL